jgi:acetyl esterase/lipase
VDTLLLWPEGAPLAAGTGIEDQPAITPYLLPGQNNPAIVVCPGGGYVNRAAHEGEPIAKWLNTLGVSAFVLRYRVAPYQYPAAWLDAKRAIRTVRGRAGEFGIDAARVGILGFSAGGHLTATVSTMNDSGNPASDDPIERQSSRPDLQVLCYPVITMKDPFTHTGSRENLLGTNPDPELLARMCTEDQVNANTPPTFLWSTPDDAAVPVANSLLFATALHRHGVLFDLHVYDNGGHGLGLASDVQHVKGWTDACASWLTKRGF